MEQKFIDKDGLKILWNQISLKDYPNNETLMAVIDAIDETKADANHTHTIESIEGLKDAVGAAADAKFYVVTFDMGSDKKYHGDLTFAEICEKFEAGGNMVARIDGTDYIPLLSAAPHKIIFSGIYENRSVALTVDSNNVCTLTTTAMANSTHGHSTATQTSSGFMSKADKIKLDGINPSNYETKEDAQIKYDTIVEAKADWNQNDETALDYIKNRPFYEYIDAVVDNVTVNNGDTLDIKLDDNIGGEGSIVTVVWDGASYEKTVSQCDVVVGKWSIPYYTIGNQSYLNDSENTFEDTGEEYLIKGQYKQLATISCNDESHTLSIIKQTIVEIDDKFLPNIWKGTGDGALVFNNNDNSASGENSHAEGCRTTASGENSHAEGLNTTASGNNSHAEGLNTTASGNNSHAEGYKTTASGNYQHVQGKYNIEDVDADGNPLNNYAHIVGNGTSNNKRSNAHTLDWDGNAWFSGDVYVGSTSGINKDEGSKKLATEDYVNQCVNNIDSNTMIVNVTLNDSTYSADKTGVEIKAAIDEGKFVCVVYNKEIYYVTHCKDTNIHFQYQKVDMTGVTSKLLSCVISSNRWAYGDGNFNYGSITEVRTSSTLTTTDKTIVGAINELNAKHTEGTDALILISPNGTKFNITVGDDGVLKSDEITE